MAVEKVSSGEATNESKRLGKTFRNGLRRRKLPPSTGKEMPKATEREEGNEHRSRNTSPIAVIFARQVDQAKHHATVKVLRPWDLVFGSSRFPKFSSHRRSGDGTSGFRELISFQNRKRRAAPVSRI